VLAYFCFEAPWRIRWSGSGRTGETCEATNAPAVAEADSVEDSFESSASKIDDI
jgi:hypothetical protein